MIDIFENDLWTLEIVFLFWISSFVVADFSELTWPGRYWHFYCLTFVLSCFTACRKFRFMIPLMLLCKLIESLWFEICLLTEFYQLMFLSKLSDFFDVFILWMNDIWPNHIDRFHVCSVLSPYWLHNQLISIILSRTDRIWPQTLVRRWKAESNSFIFLDG